MSNNHYPELGPVTSREYLIHIGQIDAPSKLFVQIPDRLSIKEAIARAGTTQAAIARHLRVSPACLSAVITGSLRSSKIEAELEKIVGKPIYKDKACSGRKKSVYNGHAGVNL